MRFIFNQSDDSDSSDGYSHFAIIDERKEIPERAKKRILHGMMELYFIASSKIQLFLLIHEFFPPAGAEPTAAGAAGDGAGGAGAAAGEDAAAAGAAADEEIGAAARWGGNAAGGTGPAGAAARCLMYLGIVTLPANVFTRRCWSLPLY